MGKKNFIVTEDLLRHANDYVPLNKKIRLAQMIAPKCLVKSKTAEQNQKGLEFLALPTMYVDDLELKNLYIMSVLLAEYLNVSIPDEFTDEEYDRYSESHILNQLERFKSNVGLKDKVFDLLGDFNEFKKILNTEIANEKEVRNDAVARFSAAISIVSDPENMKRLQKELETATAEFQKKQHEAIEKLKERTDET